MKWILWIVGLIVVIVAGGAAYWFESRPPAASTDSVPPSPPVAQVVLAAIEKKAVSEKITAFGSVIAQPGKSRFMSAAFETRVRHILVAPGEAVTKGQPLVAIEPSPAVQLQLAEAQATAEAAQQELAQTQQKFNLRLATNQEMEMAKKSAESARLQVESLNQQGVTSQTQVVSEIDGLVDKVDVQAGQIVQAGNPLAELVARDEIEAKLGVEPEDAGLISVGQAVTLSQVHLENAKSISGKIRLITERVNPNTRLVDVYVAIAPSAALLLDTYLRAELQTHTHEGLVVPRAAVLTQNDSSVLFTVDHDHAVQHTVQIGTQTDQTAEIIAGDLKAGDQVVIQGNYELTDGIAVTTGQQP